MDRLLPSNIYSRVTAELGGRKVWRRFDKYRSDRAALGDWPDWCFCPTTLAAAELVGAYGTPRGSALDLGLMATARQKALDHGGRILNKPALDVFTLGALSAWRTTQGVYRVDQDLAASLASTPLSGALPSDVLTHLPEWCVYVELSEDHGFWAYLDYQRTGERELIIVVAYGGALSPIVVGLGGTLLDGLGLVQGISESVGIDDLTVLKHVTPYVSILLYLCSTEPDICTVDGAERRPSRPRRQGPIHGAQAPTVWETGFRIGAALRKVQPEQRPASGDPIRPGRRPTGHIRRAHWHTYWVGSEKRGDRRFEFRWMPPIPVALELEDGAAPFATVRPVRSELEADR